MAGQDHTGQRWVLGLASLASFIVISLDALVVATAPQAVPATTWARFPGRPGIDGQAPVHAELHGAAHDRGGGR